MIIRIKGAFDAQALDGFRAMISRTCCHGELSTQHCRACGDKIFPSLAAATGGYCQECCAEIKFGIIIIHDDKQVIACSKSGGKPFAYQGDDPSFENGVRILEG